VRSQEGRGPNTAFKGKSRKKGEGQGIVVDGAGWRRVGEKVETINRFIIAGPAKGGRDAKSCQS